MTRRLAGTALLLLAACAGRVPARTADEPPKPLQVPPVRPPPPDPSGAANNVITTYVRFAVP